MNNKSNNIMDLPNGGIRVFFFHHSDSKCKTRLAYDYQPHLVPTELRHWHPETKSSSPVDAPIYLRVDDEGVTHTPVRGYYGFHYYFRSDGDAYFVNYTWDKDIVSDAGVPCPDCGKMFNYLDEHTLYNPGTHMVVGSKTPKAKTKCGGKCRNAGQASSCNCECGGLDHGIQHIISQILRHRGGSITAAERKEIVNMSYAFGEN